jgi:hypothetical protein
VRDGAVVSNCSQWPVLDGLSSCLLQARRVLRAKLGLGEVDARLSRDPEGEIMPNLSLRLYRQLLRFLPAVFGVVPLCLPLRYARLRLHVENGWGGGGERRGR